MRKFTLISSGRNVETSRSNEQAPLSSARGCGSFTVNVAWLYVIVVISGRTSIVLATSAPRIGSS